MKSGIKDKVEGALHVAKGSVKEMTGKMTDNPKLEATGAAEKTAGKIQAKIGHIKTVVGK